jgi:hypothetical protein
MDINNFKIILFILVLTLFSFCSDREKNHSKNATIETLYLKGLAETPIAVQCGELPISKYSSLYGNTVLCDEKKYIEILNYVKSLKLLKTDGKFTNCDIRIQCKINLTNGDSIRLCIGLSNCIIRNGQLMEKNDTLIYLIRRYSGYYNYFSKEVLLRFFHEVIQFGVPINYKDLSGGKYTPEGIPMPAE